VADDRRGWLFACPDDVITEMDLDWADAPRRISHALGAKRQRPAVSEANPPDNLGPAIWSRIFARIAVPGELLRVRSNEYGSATLYRLTSDATDYLATWTPDAADLWVGAMHATAEDLVVHFRSDARWKPLHGGAVGVLLDARGCALLARSSKVRASVFYYWYEPIGLG
jgi:hypothetical protein